MNARYFIFSFIFICFLQIFSVSSNKDDSKKFCNGCSCRVAYPYKTLADVIEPYGVTDCCKCVFGDHCECGRGTAVSIGSKKNARAYCNPCNCHCGVEKKLHGHGYKCSDCHCTDHGKCTCHDHNSSPYCCDCSESCFPSTARVSLENGKSVAISQLQIGDKVQTVLHDGNIAYSEVKEFMKKQNTGSFTYKIITTSQNNTVRLSGDHQIYIRKTSADKYHPMSADQVTNGDTVLVETSGKLIPEEVINVSSLIMQGAHAPLTKEGIIVVDGVLTSCYASINHDMAHIGMSPIRWFPKVMELIFGKENGYTAYVYVPIGIGRLAMFYGNSVIFDF